MGVFRFWFAQVVVPVEPRLVYRPVLVPSGMTRGFEAGNGLLNTPCGTPWIAAGPLEVVEKPSEAGSLQEYPITLMTGIAYRA
jgi:hypothetical protein